MPIAGYKGPTMFKRIVAVILATLFVAGCNTMEGAGKDIERGGEKIQDKAK
jgi:predicted small secreted protein